jgi:AmmeMemoRadiSam system protein A
VTLDAAGALRGCVGHPHADRPLGEVVRDVTVAAARDDPRFDPVLLEELPVVRIHISVLTEPQKLQPVLPQHIVVGRDGLLVRRRDASAILLPQVAPEQRWGPDAFLAAACRKAGLAPDAWREPGTEVFTFQADVFGESGEEGRGKREE